MPRASLTAIVKTKAVSPPGARQGSKRKAATSSKATGVRKARKTPVTAERRVPRVEARVVDTVDDTPAPPAMPLSARLAEMAARPFQSAAFRQAFGQVSESVMGFRQRLCSAAKVLVAPQDGKDEVTFSGLTKENFAQVQAFFRFHEMEGPTRASDPKKLVRVAYVKDFMVGAILCNVSSSRKDPSLPCRVYIDSLAVFKPYRRLAVGKALVEWVLNEVEQMGPGRVRDVYLHTPACFLSAHRFYQRLGFKVLKRIPNYYTKEDGDHSHEAIVFSRSFIQ